MQTDADARSAQCKALSASTNGKTHDEHAEEMLDPALIMRLVCGSHRCQNMLDANGRKVLCNYQLWGIENSEAIETLTQQRKRFLAQPDKARGMEATPCIVPPSAAATQVSRLPTSNNASWSTSSGQTMPFAAEFANRDVFLAHNPVGLATLKRLVSASKRKGISPYDPKLPKDGGPVKQGSELAHG
eukprot:4174592-Pleurochrysis_carterae.AAC.1